MVDEAEDFQRGQVPALELGVLLRVGRVLGGQVTKKVGVGSSRSLLTRRLTDVALEHPDLGWGEEEADDLLGDRVGGCCWCLEGVGTAEGMKMLVREDRWLEGPRGVRQRVVMGKSWRTGGYLRLCVLLGFAPPHSWCFSISLTYEPKYMN